MFRSKKNEKLKGDKDKEKERSVFEERVREAIGGAEDADDDLIKFISDVYKDLSLINKRLHYPADLPVAIENLQEDSKNFAFTKEQNNRLNKRLNELRDELSKKEKELNEIKGNNKPLDLLSDKEIEREYLKRKHLKPGATFKINNVNMVIDCLEYNEKGGEAVYFFDTRNDDLITSKMSVDAVLGIMGVYDV